MMESSTGDALVRIVIAPGRRVVAQMHRTAEEDHQQNESPDRSPESCVQAP
jgi:hypothetical protein